MPNGYRVRQVNRLENVGSPAVRTFQPLQRSGQGLCMRSGAAVRSAEELRPASRSVETNSDAMGIPKYGQEWMARGACVN
jgi:hypothetical protein